MEISRINFYSYNAKVNPNFCGLGVKKLNLRYMLQQRGNVLPPTIKSKISELLQHNNQEMPTLRELHLSTYAPLLDCKSLSEAQNMFPEFGGVLDAKDVLRPTGKTMSKVVEHCSPDGLSLLLLQEIWARLKHQDILAKELGLTHYQKLDHIKDRILFPKMGQAYTTLLKASDPELNAQIAAKTTAYNKLHPDLMYAHNRHAAQFSKTPEARKKHGDAVRQFYNENPSERKRVSETATRVWDRLPHIKQAIKDFLMSDCSVQTSVAMKRSAKGEPMTDADKRMVKIFYKKFWEKHPEFRKEYSDMWKQVASEIKTQKS